MALAFNEMATVKNVHVREETRYVWKPELLAQSSRWYQATSLADDNATSANFPEVIRLRMSSPAISTPVLIDGVNIRLQYSTSPTGPWTDVVSGDGLQFRLQSTNAAADLPSESLTVVEGDFVFPDSFYVSDAFGPAGQTGRAITLSFAGKIYARVDGTLWQQVYAGQDQSKSFWGLFSTELDAMANLESHFDTVSQMSDQVVDGQRARHYMASTGDFTRGDFTMLEVWVAKETGYPVKIVHTRRTPDGTGEEKKYNFSRFNEDFDPPPVSSSGGAVMLPASQCVQAVAGSCVVRGSTNTFIVPVQSFLRTDDMIIRNVPATPTPPKVRLPDGTWAYPTPTPAPQ
ncbi:MAG: hypothetical protein FJ319_00315 [SAR202 cluster bacterium]|nr:hypothetical protein [SAR202 cluster bacterium]